MSDLIAMTHPDHPGVARVRVGANGAWALTGGGVFDPQGLNRGALVLTVGSGGALVVGADLARTRLARTDAEQVCPTFLANRMAERRRGPAWNSTPGWSVGVWGRNIDNEPPNADIVRVPITSPAWGRSLALLPWDAFVRPDPDNPERTLLGLVCETLGESAWRMGQAPTVERFRRAADDALVFLVLAALLAAEGVPGRPGDARSVAALDKTRTAAIRRLRLKERADLDLVEALRPPVALETWRDRLLLASAAGGGAAGAGAGGASTGTGGSGRRRM